jgi:hypothetical protein
MDSVRFASVVTSATLLVRRGRASTGAELKNGPSSINDNTVRRLISGTIALVDIHAGMKPRVIERH